MVRLVIFLMGIGSPLSLRFGGPRTARTLVRITLLTLLLVPWPRNTILAQDLTLRGPDGLPTLAHLLEEVTPAVVNLSVVSRSAWEKGPLLQDPFFQRYFGRPENLAVQPRTSVGSGVIVEAELGYVLTNHHLVKSAADIHITLQDGRRLRATIIGRDPGTDIALLQVKPDGLTALQFGDSDGLRVGDFVVAIGNPFGMGQTVTSGLVSALGRSGLNVEGYEDYIQTDASINPGNSGGALVDLRGKLVGINTAIIAPSGGNVGIGFAVPSRIARSVMQQIVEFGEVRRGYLGIIMKDLTPELAQARQLDLWRGVIVVEVEPGSPAERAGLMKGDVILSINGRTLQGATDLRNRIGLMPRDQAAELLILRDGEERQVRALPEWK